jgi:homoserine dehydrogenase
MGDNARLVMVMHPVLEGRFTDAIREISDLSLLRARPRSIRVVEEEFVA